MTPDAWWHWVVTSPETSSWGETYKGVLANQATAEAELVAQVRGRLRPQVRPAAGAADVELVPKMPEVAAEQERLEAIRDVPLPMGCPACRRNMPRLRHQLHGRWWWQCPSCQYVFEGPPSADEKDRRRWWEEAKGLAEELKLRELASRLEDAAQALTGRAVRTQRAWTEAVQGIILDLDREVSLVGALSADNCVIQMDYRIGSATQVPHSAKDVAALARDAGAAKVVSAHNHPGADPTPSDADVLWAADLHLLLDVDGIALVDDIVVCQEGGTRQLRSVLRTRRFQDLVRAY